MFKIERKIVEFVERNVNILFMLAITGLAIEVWRLLYVMQEEILFPVI